MKIKYQDRICKTCGFRVYHTRYGYCHQCL